MVAPSAGFLKFRTVSTKNYQVCMECHSRGQEVSIGKIVNWAKLLLIFVFLPSQLYSNILNMSSDNASSPKFKNTPSKPKQSPAQIREKLRRSYRNKAIRCRDRLKDQLRDMMFVKENMFNKLKDLMYKNITESTEDTEDVEDDVLQEVKDELVQEELEWFLEEYQKSQMDNVDWSNVEQENDIVCPVCRKENFTSASCTLKCSRCNILVKTSMQTTDVKDHIYKCLDKHNSSCVSDPQFTVIKDDNDSHIYLICETCSEMSFVL